MDETPKGKRLYSRREVLRKAPLAVAGGIVLGLVSGKPLLSRLRRRRQAPKFPEGSIFTPADDRRKKL